MTAPSSTDVPWVIRRRATRRSTPSWPCSNGCLSRPATRPDGGTKDELGARWPRRSTPGRAPCRWRKPSQPLVGFVTANRDLDSIRFGPRCWIEDLAVDPTRRSAGIGRALLEAAKVWASEHGATHLELDTASARKDAQRFDERRQPIAKGYTYSWAL